MRARTWIPLALALVLAIGAAPFAQAQPYYFEVELSGANEVPPNETMGTGFGTLYLDNQDRLHYDISFENMTGPLVGAHIHRGVAGENGPVIYPFPAPLESPFVGYFDFNPDDLFDLLNEGLYVNLHTELYPGGEIRGQILQVPTPIDESTWGRIKAIYMR